MCETPRGAAGRGSRAARGACERPRGAAAQDYCGLLSEEAVRKNGVLLYEVLDEVIDYGFPQNSSSAALREFVLNEPTVLHSAVRAPPG